MHYFDPHAAKTDKQHTISTTIATIPLTLTTCPGLFSWKDVDKGSRILLHTLAQSDIQPQRILDSGCGYGVLSIRCAKKRPQSHVTCIDINHVATDMTQRNMTDNNIAPDRYNVVTSNIITHQDTKFDLVITNPPFSAGKETCFWLYKQAKDLLSPWGQIRSVVPTKKWAKSHAAFLSDLYGTMQYTALQSGYRVIVSTKKER